MWWSCLLMDQDEMCNLYKGPSIDALISSFGFIWKSAFRREDLKKSPNQKQELSSTAMFVNRTFHRCFLPSFGSFDQDVSEEKIFRNRPIRNKNCLWRPCLLMYRDEISIIYRGPSIDACCQVSVHLAKRFQRKIIFRNRPIRNKNCLWWPCLLTD